MRRIWILVGKPNERKKVCKEEWEDLGTKEARHGAALGRQRQCRDPNWQLLYEQPVTSRA